MGKRKFIKSAFLLWFYSVMLLAVVCGPAAAVTIDNFYNAPDPFSTPTVSVTNTYFTPSADEDLQIEMRSATNSQFVRRFYSNYPGSSPVTLNFDGKADDGAYLSVGTYLAKARMGLTATFNTIIQGTGAVMSNPQDAYTDENGNTYVVNSGNDVLELFNSSGQLLRKISDVTGGGVPYGVAYATSTGKIYISYVSAAGVGKVAKYSSTGATEDLDYFCKTGCTITLAAFSNGPRGLGVDGDKLYVADYSAGKVHCINISTNANLWSTNQTAPMDSTVAVVGTLKYVYSTNYTGDIISVINESNGSASSTFSITANCDGPAGIASSGVTGTDLYISCALGNKIYKYTSRKIARYGVGSLGNSTSPPKFSSPFGMGFAGSSVFVSDTTNQRIMKLVDTGAAFTYTLKIEGDSNNIFGPTDMAIDGNKNIYIASNKGNFVKEFTKDGLFVRSIGGPGTGSGEFNGIKGLEVCDSTGDGDADYIYVADYYNERIQCYSVISGAWNNAGSCGAHWGASGLTLPSAGSGDDYPYGMGIDSRSNIGGAYKLYLVAPEKSSKLYYLNIPNCVLSSTTFNNSGFTAVNIGIDVAVDFNGNPLMTTGTSQQLRQNTPNNNINFTDELSNTKRANYGITADTFGNLYSVGRAASYGKVIKIGHYYMPPVTAVTGAPVFSFGTYGSGEQNDELLLPYGLAVDPDAQFIWVADEANDRAKKFMLNYTSEYTDNVTICANATPTVTAVTLSDPSPTQAGIVKFTVNFDACGMNVEYVPEVRFKTANPYNVSHYVYNEAVVVDANSNNVYDSGETVVIGTPPPPGTALKSMPANTKHTAVGAFSSAMAICIDANADSACQASEAAWASSTAIFPQAIYPFAANEKYPDYDNDDVYDGYYVNNEWRGLSEIPEGEDGIATIYVCGNSPAYTGPLTTGGKQMDACDSAWQFTIDTTGPNAIITEPQENVTTNTVVSVSGKCETNCDVRIVMTDFSCLARDASGDDSVDGGESISNCAGGETLTSFESTEGFADCVATGTEYIYDAGEAILYDNPTQGTVGSYDPAYDMLMRCCGPSSCAEAGFNNTCSAPCAAPYSGQEVHSFETYDPNVKTVVEAFQEVETSAASDTFYANYMLLTDPVPGFKYLSAIGTDLSGNTGPWSTPRHRIKRELSDPGTAVVSPTNAEIIGGKNTWEISYAAVAPFTGCTCGTTDSTCYVKISIPSGWSGPTNAPGSPGEIVVQGGTGATLCGSTPGGTDYTVSGQDITILISSMSVGSTINVTYGYTGNGGPGSYIGESSEIGLNYFLMKSCNICGLVESDLSNPNIVVHGRQMKVYHSETLGTAGRIYDNTTDKTVMNLVFSNPDQYGRTYQVTGLQLIMAASPTTLVPSDVISKVYLRDGSGNIVLTDNTIESTGNTINLEGLSAAPINVNSMAQNSIQVSMDFKCLSASCSPALGITRLAFGADAQSNLYSGTSSAISETSLTDGTKSWTTNSLQGYFLIPDITKPSKSYAITGNSATIIFVEPNDTMLTDGLTTASYRVGGPGSTFTIFDVNSGTAVRVNSDRAQTASDTFYPDWPASQNPQMHSGVVTVFSPPPIAKQLVVTPDITT